MKVKLTKKYQNNLIFQDFKLEIIDQKINIILGPSGCGKTTLLNCIAQLCDFDGYIEPNVHKIGYVFQEDRLFPHLTVMKNLSIIEPSEDRIINLLKKFNVFELRNQYPGQLSGGEKQRISIIRAFLGNHDMILMDEPFKSLDYQIKNDLALMIQQMEEETKKTIILVTHDLEIALYLGNMIHILSNKTTTVKESIHNPYVYQALNEKNVVLLNHLKQLMVH